MASALAKVMVDEKAVEDYRIWKKVKRVLHAKGADAAIATLKSIRVEQEFSKLYAAQKLFEHEFTKATA